MSEVVKRVSFAEWARAHRATMERPCSCGFNATPRGGHTRDCEFHKSWDEMMEAWRVETGGWAKCWGTEMDGEG